MNYIFSITTNPPLPMFCGNKNSKSVQLHAFALTMVLPPMLITSTLA